VRSNIPKVVRNLLLLLALAALLGLLSRRFAAAQNGTDFPEFYAAAKMVGEGAGRQLYDPAAQDRFEIRYAGRTGTYFNHPPFEALVYWPLTRWPLRGAYLVWCLLNAGFLAVVARLLAPEVFPHRDWRVLLVLFFLFVPVLLNFLQGQDSLLLLLLLSLAFAALKREKEFAAGCLLACGLFKFHLVIPLVVVLLARPTARREKRLATGFLGAGALLVSISAAVSGWGFLSAYPRFLQRLGSLPLAGIHPEEMANLRGLVSLFPLPEPARYALILVASLVVLAVAILGQRQASKDWGATAELAFANAVMAGVLVGYHLSPHDLSVLLLPMALILPSLRRTNWNLKGVTTSRRTMGTSSWLAGLGVAVAAVLVLPPFQLWLLAEHRYAWVAVPVLLLFAANYRELRRASPGTPANR
jgi:Glycosyltransferase family 87